MAIVWDDDPNFIDLAMILFTEGGGFSLENEVLHHMDDKEQEQPAVWGRSRPRKAPNLERFLGPNSSVQQNVLQQEVFQASDWMV